MTNPNNADAPEKADKKSGSDSLTSRLAAHSLLEGVVRRSQTLDSLLDTDKSYNGLVARDKGFCRMLVSTTLRRLGQIDNLIAQVESKPGSTEKNPALQNVLRLGVCQLFFMATADHAALDTSVRLAERLGMERQKGFVNGMLRNLQRTGQELLPRQDEGRLNTPEWLLKTWIEDYGLREAAEIARANLAEAPLDITVKDKDSVNYWSANLQAASFPTGSLRMSAGGSVTDLQGFDDGMWWVQDASASLPAQLFGDVKERTVIDLCAAPGGKTAQLASMGANVIAIDRSATRLRRLHENMERLRLGEHVQTAASDAGSWRAKEAPQYILLDAPCSATGTIRRHPDVLRLKSPDDIARLVHIQAKLLRHAYSVLAPGGILIYCTCSLQKSEGEQQIASFLKETPDAHKIAIRPDEVGDMQEIITEDGDVRILPYMRAASGGMDGFFISRIRKG